jgi:hypothetical protein
MRLGTKGFALVFAEDVPEVSTQDIVTGTSKRMLMSIYVCGGSWKRVILSRPMEETLLGVRYLHQLDFVMITVALWRELESCLPFRS